ncbi:serpin family protein [Bacillus sp. FJAT-49736]|uniref:serpin family protein n=1 Tax=Bacillus sp. FJAT-49736 TaxID=2833582 RepID=UPI001BC9B02D|nr:serpin family protein [Bacillus sp. FJAT-49736]MBS4172855.1 serpin family protein [Bacillus sp. FJAT-49736]
MKKWSVPLLLLSVLLFATGCGTNNASDGLAIAKNVQYGKDDYTKIVSSQNQLGFDWLQNIEKDKYGNAFISPTSLFLALAMVYNGADGETNAEIAQVLHTEALNKDELSKANASLMAKLHQHTKKIELNVANSIWLDKNYHIQKNFSQVSKDYYNAKIQEINKNDPKWPSLINDWVSGATNHKIKKIVDPSSDSDFIALLINAIYFKGNWENEFDKKNTVKRNFHLQDGSIKEVPLMKLKEELDYMENDSFQAVSLPYVNGEMSMKIFLPKENTTLDQFEKMLTSEHWKEWNLDFRSRPGTVMLPKFQLNYQVMLNDTLKKLGMKSAFAANANFSKMIQEDAPIYISKVQQKTFLNVDEKGSEAAAATSVAMTKGAPSREEPFQMKVNRPFFITIVDDGTGTILFMGAISNPQEAKR